MTNDELEAQRDVVLGHFIFSSQRMTNMEYVARCLNQAIHQYVRDHPLSPELKQMLSKATSYDDITTLPPIRLCCSLSICHKTYSVVTDSDM